MAPLGRRRWLDAVERSLVWIVGSPRTGSTWLLNMLALQANVVASDEPLIGLHLGATIDQIMAAPAAEDPDQRLRRVYDMTRMRADYFFSDAHSAVWRPMLRALVLTRLGAQFGLGRRGPARCAIKEPHGSEAADVLASLTPESRLLMLVRDGRDVVDSELDAVLSGSWASGALTLDTADPVLRLTLLEQQARRWLLRTEVACSAYEAHDPSRRLMLRYEDLLSDTEGELRRILVWLDIRPAADLAEMVGRMSFASVPAERTGPGKFHRAATPGMWRTAFSVGEQQLLGEILDQQLTRLGYDPTRQGETL